MEAAYALIRRMADEFDIIHMIYHKGKRGGAGEFDYSWGEFDLASLSQIGGIWLTRYRKIGVSTDGAGLALPLQGKKS